MRYTCAMGASKIAAVVLFLALALPQAHAAAWKCQVNGKTVFSEVPCPDSGKRIDTESGQTRGFSGDQETHQREAPRLAAAGVPEPRAGRAPAARAECPTALQIKNWETSASSRFQDASATEARRQLKRAKQCHAGLDPAAEEVKEVKRKRAHPKVCTSIGGGNVLCP